MQETSTKPYLIRALHEWCTDNGYTPHIVVTINSETVVPMAYAQEGQITLNLGVLATNNLVIDNEYIQFQARFSGAVEDIFVPIGAVSGIYARETGAGMAFEVTDTPLKTEIPTKIDESTTKSDNSTTSNRPPHLKIIK